MESSVRPAPIRPAIPRTSPFLRLKLMLSQTLIPSNTGWSTHQFLTSKQISPILDSRLGKRSVILRPTIAEIIVSSEKSSFALSREVIEAPSRITVILSATYETSFNLCEMIIDVIPCFLNSRRRSSRCFASLSLREAVGSSRIRSFTFFPSAFAISTSCCLPTPISLISVLDESLSPTMCKSSSALSNVSDQLIFALVPLSFPRNIFSPIVRSGTSASS